MPPDVIFRRMKGMRKFEHGALLKCASPAPRPYFNAKHAVRSPKNSTHKTLGPAFRGDTPSPPRAHDICIARRLFGRLRLPTWGSVRGPLCFCAGDKPDKTAILKKISSRGVCEQTKKNESTSTI